MQNSKDKISKGSLGFQNQENTLKYLEQQLQTIEQAQGGQQDQEMRSLLEQLSIQLNNMNQQALNQQLNQHDDEYQHLKHLDDIPFEQEQTNIQQHLNSIDNMMAELQSEIQNLDPETQQLLGQTTSVLVGNDENLMEHKQITGLQNVNSIKSIALDKLDKLDTQNIDRQNSQIQETKDLNNVQLNQVNDLAQDEQNEQIASGQFNYDFNE